MSTEHTPFQIDMLRNRFGLRVAARLSAGTQNLPHDVTERLRAARMQALAQRRQPVAVLRRRTAGGRLRNGATAALNLGDDMLGFWGRVVSAALAVVMAAGLVTINVVQDDDRTTEVANVDAALLTDELPPQAYADPGFLQFLKTGAGHDGVRSAH